MTLEPKYISNLTYINSIHTYIPHLSTEIVENIENIIVNKQVSALAIASNHSIDILVLEQEK